VRWLSTVGRDDTGGEAARQCVAGAVSPCPYVTGRVPPAYGAAGLKLFDVPLLSDPYAKNRATGSFILIDEATGVTVCAGMING
jgi:hypothetical protein